MRLSTGFGEWLWKHVVGLQPTAPAFANVSVAPLIEFADGPASASGSLLTARGLIMVAWNISLARDRIQLTVNLPVGVQHAVVAVPAPFIKNGTQATPQDCTVLESGAVLWNRTAVNSKYWPEGVLSVNPGNTTQLSSGLSVVQATVVGNGHFTFEASVLS